MKYVFVLKEKRVLYTGNMVEDDDKLRIFGNQKDAMIAYNKRLEKVEVVSITRQDVDSIAVITEEYMNECLKDFEGIAWIASAEFKDDVAPIRIDSTRHISLYRYPIE
ncbi:MAG: hypothetical protein NC218_01545 [Acetobacter sp.]|nr:hypothetical protein [Acetobacter sp.]